MVRPNFARAFRRFIYLVLVFVTVLCYQNCSFVFSPAKFTAHNARLSGGGNGDNYDGKPDNGQYYREVDHHDCPDQTKGLFGQIIVSERSIKGEINDSAHCRIKKEEISPAKIEFSPYNKGILGYKDGIYLKAASFAELRRRDNLVEAWCRWEKSPLEGIDIVVRMNKATKELRAELLEGRVDLTTNTVALLRQENVTVTRHLEPNRRELRYDGRNLSLKLDLSSQQKNPLGTFKAETDRVPGHPLNCRLGGELDTQSFTLNFRGASLPSAPVPDRVFNQTSSPAWVLEGICDPLWGDVTIGGALNQIQTVPCSTDGLFSLAIHYNDLNPTPYFTGNLYGAQYVQIEQGPASPKVTTLFKTDTSYSYRLISSAAELQAIPPATPSLYILTRDIDLASEVGLTNNWNPIGRGTSVTSNDMFQGILEGNDHVISNLHMSGLSGDQIGLMGSMYGGINFRGGTSAIQNLHINGAYISVSGSNVGVFVGYSRIGQVINCSATNVQVEGLNSVGGLVGYARDSEVRRSRVSGQVRGKNSVGGAIGLNWNGEIGNLSARVDVIATGVSAGGLVGEFRSGGATLENSVAQGDVVGFSKAGGLIGQLTEGVLVRNTLAYGHVQVLGDSNGGPLVGFVGNATLLPEPRVEDSYWSRDKICENCMPPVMGEGRLDEELYFSSTYSNWNFSSPVWMINDGFSLPDLYE